MLLVLIPKYVIVYLKTYTTGRCAVLLQAVTLHRVSTGGSSGKINQCFAVED